MQAVVPAAGEGTRLQPLTNDRPKGLVEVAGRPLLVHCLSALADLGLTEVIMVVGHHGNQIVDEIGQQFDGIDLTYVHQDEPRGLADAILTAASAIDSDFIVLNGDNVFRANLDEAVNHHQATGADATLLVEKVTRESARQTGVCVFDEEGELLGLVEKPDDPPSLVALTGAFVFSPAIMDACRLITTSDRGEYELPDAIDLLCRAGRPVETVPLEGWRINVNTPSDVRVATRQLEGDTSGGAAETGR